MPKPKIVKAKAPDAYLYEATKKERPVRDKDLFIMNKSEKKIKTK